MSDTDLIRLDNQLCFMLYACSRAMTKAYQPMLKDLELTYPQYLVLMVLWEWADTEPEEPTVKALGARLRLDSGTLTPLLKRMEQQALVSRSRDSEDERRVFVRVADKGLGLQPQAQQWLNKSVSAMPISLDKIDTLRTDLKQLLDFLPA